MTKRHDPHYLQDIEQACELIANFLKEITKTQFKKDSMRQSAVIKQLEIIGEAARHLSAGFKKSNAKIPWAKMTGLRNILVHVYHEADLDLVWNTAKKKVPTLLTQIRSLQDKGSKGSEE